MTGLLRAVRKQRGLTLSSLAEQTGLTKSYLSKIERRQSTPSIAVALKVARALDVDVAQLFSEQIRGQQVIVGTVLAAIVGAVDNDGFVCRFVREQLCDVDIERAGNLKRHRDRRCALATLDLRQITLRQPGLLGEGGQREAALLADRP